MLISHRTSLSCSKYFQLEILTDAMKHLFHFDSEITRRKSNVNRHRRKRPKVDASIFDSALSHTRRSDVSKKREENSVSTFGRFRLWTSFESSPVSVKVTLF